MQKHDVKANSLKWAIAASLFLTVFKGLGAFFTASHALLASALDSLMDASISSANFFSLKKAAAPPDHDHAYGHGKIESLASYTQGVMIFVFAVGLLWQTVKHSLEKSHAIQSLPALFVIAVSCGVNFILIRILNRADEKSSSLILKAEKTHYFMDILTYIASFAAILLVKLTGWMGWDLAGSYAVVFYVMWLSGKIIYQAANELVDRSLPQHELSELDALIRGHDRGILGYHEMRTRKVGETVFIDFHLDIDARESFERAHLIADSLIAKIKEIFPGASVTVHEDPREINA